MNALWIAFLGAGGTAGIGSFIYTVYRDVRDRRYRESKQDVEVQIDSATETRIAAEAAQINSDVAIAQQTWWKDQFTELRKELVAEQAARRRITVWAHKHQMWDRKAWLLAIESDPNYPPPPELEDDPNVGG